MKHEVADLLQMLMAEDPEHLLRAETVVEVAEHLESPLHNYFEWDDSVAAHQHRLSQARTLICSVRILNPDAMHKEPTPMYVSLAPDRTRHGGGYRAISEVLSSETLRAELMKTAIAELHVWTKRYHMLVDLVQAVEDIVKQQADEAAQAKTRRQHRALPRRKVVLG